MNLIAGCFGILFFIALVTLLIISSTRLSVETLGYRLYSWLFTEITALPFLIFILLAYQPTIGGLLVGVVLILVDLFLLRRTVASLRLRSREDIARNDLMVFFDGLNKGAQLPYSVERPPIAKEELAGFEGNKKIFRFIIMPIVFLLPVVMYAIGEPLEYEIGYGIFIVLPFLILIGVHFETSKMYDSGDREIIKGVIINKYLKEEQTSSGARRVTTSEGYFNISGKRMVKVGSQYDRFTLGDKVEITIWGPGIARYNRITSIKKTGQLLPN